MKSYNIAVIGGDGTGPEVTREAINNYPASEFRPQFLYRLQLAQRVPAPAAAAPAPAAPVKN